MYKSAHYCFTAILALVILGFWPSYFAPSADKATFAQHFHSFVMLGWMLMLIVQPLVGLPRPFPPIGLSFFWLGFASALFYAVLYTLAIIKRKDMQLHAS